MTRPRPGRTPHPGDPCLLRARIKTCAEQAAQRGQLVSGTYHDVARRSDQPGFGDWNRSYEAWLGWEPDRGVETQRLNLPRYKATVRRKRHRVR